MIFQDYQLDEDGDLLIENGDFVVGPSDQQHIVDILQAFQGEYKQFPLLGANLMTLLKGENPNEAINIIKTQLQSDGYDVSQVKATTDVNGKVKIVFPKGGVVRNV